MPGKRRSEPQFKYSALPEMLASGWAFIFVLVATAYAISSATVNALDISWVSLIEIFLIYLTFERWRLQFWSVRFYDDSIVLEKRGAHYEKGYSDIVMVELRKSVWWGSRVILRAGQGSPIVVFKNPKDRKSGVDLYSWLLNKRVVSNDAVGKA